jgi:hypothetical protein
MIIATRTLTLREGDRDIAVPIRVFAPEQQPRDWSCRFEIDWPDEPFAMAVIGIDAVQALGLALKTVGTQIYTSEYHEAGQLFWHEPGNGYGFPVPVTLRDLLIGDDAKFL